ncbi:hypothetical protein [Fodinicola acaciae]|uniref:hypothetical protein n=1 Tax=Fodinicola acaciae TaxID=2681555 RepID=UPI0013D2D4CB|nr:hypothetical protein [Fodinicola acaciae]
MDNREPALSHVPGEPMVVVVGPAGDTDATAMCDALARRGISYAPVDPSQFEHSMHLDVRLRCDNGDDGRWTGELRTIDHTIAVEDVSAIYYRPPRLWVREPGGNSITGPVRRMVPGPRALSREAHARVTLYGMLASLPCRWVNHPGRYTDEHRLPLLTAAANSGFRLPASLLANNRQGVTDFACKHGKNVLCVPLVDPEAGAAYSRPVLRAEYQHHRLDGFLFQEYVEREVNVHVIVAGNRLFAFRTHEDAYDLTTVTDEVASSIWDFQEDTGLGYTALDFAVPRDGPWVLTQIDPTAEWSWYAMQFDLPVADALVDALTKAR